MTLKKLLSAGLIAGLAIGFTGCKYDDDDVWSAINDQEKRIAALEQWQQSTNTNIAALQAIVNESDFIKSVTPISEGGKVIGYTISFLHQGDIVIYNGEKGDKGDTGAQGDKGDKGDTGDMPVIGVEQLSDGLWYWTINGELLKDAQGNPICASGRDGANGEPGADGKPGTPGAPGTPGTPGSAGTSAPLPELKTGSELGGSYIPDAVYLSVDGGKTWVKVSADSAAGGSTSGTSTCIFKEAPKDMGAYWMFTLANGTQISVPKYEHLNLTFTVDGTTAPITGGAIEVPLESEFSIQYAVADESMTVSYKIVEISDNLSSVKPTEDGTALKFPAYSSSSSFTIIFTMTDRYNQARFYKVAVTVGKRVVIDAAENPELAEALEAIGFPKEDGVVAITPEECEEKTYLNLTTPGLEANTIASLGEIFPNLEVLDCPDIAITELDLTNFPNLTQLNCSNNPLTELDLSAQTELERLDCNNCFNQTSSRSRSVQNGVLDLSANKNLKYLNCSNNNLTELNVSSCDKLVELTCWDNNLSKIDISNNPLLRYIDCSNNNLTELDLSANNNLEILICSNNSISNLEISNSSLLNLACNYNAIESLNTANIPNLSELNCIGNKISDIDLSKNKELKRLFLSSTTIEAIDLSNNSKLTELNCNNTGLNSLDITNLLLLENLSCNGCYLKTLDITKCVNLNSLRCGNQRKPSSTDWWDYQEMVLVLTSAQMELWENDWVNGWGNEYVKLSDQPVSEAGGNGPNFGNGGIF